MPFTTLKGLLVTTLAAFTLLFGLALSAEAKMPQFETSVEADGTSATLTVTLQKAAGFAPAELEGVVAVYPQSAVDGSGKPVDHSSRIDVVLTEVPSEEGRQKDDGVYMGVVDLGRAGSWAAVSMPDLHADVVSYPDPVYFQTASGTAWGWFAGGSAVILTLGALVWRPRKAWKPLLATAGIVGLLVVGTAVIAGDGKAPFECPVTIPPQPGFSPPEPWADTYPYDGSVWYGDEELWTVLETDGTYGPRKSVWWSVNFPGGAQEARPELHVTWTRLDTAERVVIGNQGKAINAHTAAEGWFMVAGIDPDMTDADLSHSGCWRVTAEYKGATLSYVYER